MKVVILERNSVGTDISIDEIMHFGETDVYENTVTAEEVGERIREADIVISNKAPLNESNLKDAPNVKLICEFATGFDNVDIAYCKSRGISVANVVNYSTDSVAQHTFALALYLLEHLNHYDHYVKDGEYGAQSRFSNFDLAFPELTGKTWGIIGMGNIGRKVASIAEAFGCRVITHPITGKGAKQANCELVSKDQIDCKSAPMGQADCELVSKNRSGWEHVSMDELLNRSDVLSLHCPLSDLSRGLINYEALCKMKKSAVLINVARGPVVVDADLARALNEGLIAGAGLDVTSTEPLTADNPLNEIKDSDKLLITPHLAWASTEARIRVVSETAKNIQAFLAGEKRNVVNL